MGQQASLTKLKEKIEAAKRSLSNMPPDGQSNGDDQLKTLDFEFDEHQIALQRNSTPTNEGQYNEKTGPTEFQGAQATKQKVTNDNVEEVFDSELMGQQAASNKESSSMDFQFFRRPKQPQVVPVDLGNKNTDIDETTEDNYAYDYELLNDLRKRLTKLETDVGKNCGHIDELVKMSSRLEPNEITVTTPISISRLIRRYLFWFVMGILIVGWYALTPSGQEGLSYLLNV